MSGAPKRSHEETAHSSSKYPPPPPPPPPPPHEDPSSFSKLSSSVSADYHAPYDVGGGPDTRLPKIPRTELRDAAVVDRKILPPTVYRIPSDSHVDSNAAAAAW